MNDIIRCNISHCQRQFSVHTHQGSLRLLRCRPSGQPLRLLLLCFLPQLLLSLDELLLLSLPGRHTALVPLQVRALGRRQVLLGQSRDQPLEGCGVHFTLRVQLAPQFLKKRRKLESDKKSC